MPRVKGPLDKNDVKDFLREKYEESKVYREKKLVRKILDEITAVYDTCPHCQKDFDIEMKDMEILEDERHIYARIKCPNCGAKLIANFRPSVDIDPLFGGRENITVEIVEDKENDKQSGK